MKQLVMSIIVLSLMGGVIIGRYFSSTDPLLAEQVAKLNHNLESHRHRRATEDKYDVRIVGAAAKFSAGEFPNTIDGQPLEEQHLLNALPLLLKELDRYPVDAIKLTGIHKIVLCGTLLISKQSEGGLADFASSTIYLSLPEWDVDGSTLPRSLDHEVFHFIDETAHRTDEDDQQWSRLSPKGFTYGKGGITAEGEMASTEMTDKWPGFVTPYCRSAPAEDKAETFACMMTAADAIAQRSKTDPVVASKVKLIRKRCLELCPELAP
jgi:hypothetical protein